MATAPTVTVDFFRAAALLIPAEKRGCMSACARLAIAPPTERSRHTSASPQRRDGLAPANQRELGIHARIITVPISWTPGLRAASRIVGIHCTPRQ